MNTRGTYHLIRPGRSCPTCQDIMSWRAQHDPSLVVAPRDNILVWDGAPHWQERHADQTRSVVRKRRR